MVATVRIADREIGPGHPCFVIAEAGVNHNGSIDLARQLVDAAAEAGADAVKFQTFTAERLATRSAPKADYQLKTTGAAQSQFEMLRELELSAESHKDLMEYCAEKGILFMSSPFDEISADLLDDLNVAAFKIPSGEITNLKYLAHIARKGRPMIVSTGMANLEEVAAAVQSIRDSGNPKFILLHCVSNYPANPKDANLRAMSTMASAFGVPVGYSDHTLGTSTPLAAVALGACVIEKHLTLDKHLPGPDHIASLEPHEFKSLVEEIRSVESSLGHGRKEPVPSEANTAAAARKSLVAAVDIPAGTLLTEELIIAKRPGTGLSPALLGQVLERKVRCSIPEGSLITMEMLE